MNKVEVPYGSRIGSRVTDPLLSNCLEGNNLFVWLNNLLTK